MRFRLGLWLVRPWLSAEMERCYLHAKNNDKPTSYHPDWWWGGYFSLARLKDGQAVHREPRLLVARNDLGDSGVAEAGGCGDGPQ